MVRTKCDDAAFQRHFFRNVRPQTFAVREEHLLTVHTLLLRNEHVRVDEKPD